MRIVRRIAGRINRVLGSPPEVIHPAQPDPMNRRNERSELGGIPPGYFEHQAAVVRETIVPQLRTNPELDLGVVLGRAEHATLGERVVEYAWIAQRLIRDQQASRRGKLLDVGCVLNNPGISRLVTECCDSIWLMNPSPEPFDYSDRAAFILADVRKHFLPGHLKFSKVTCLSTIEHVGMNNLRYGGDAGVVTSQTEHPEDHAKDALRRLWDLTEVDGELCISVPFGPFEYLYVADDRRPIYYTFDAPRLKNLLQAVAPFAEWQTEIWKVEPGRGWFRTTPDDSSILPHATQCVGAGGVALASIRKRT